MLRTRLLVIQVYVLPSISISEKSLLTIFQAKSGCDGGGAYMCSNQQPWAVSDTLAYGFAAVNIAGQNEYGWCCSCYELTFTSGPASGKRMIVQATNTGADLGHNHFDIAMPGGGVGIFNACSTQYNAPTDGWGQRYGGVRYVFKTLSMKTTC